MKNIIDKKLLKFILVGIVNTLVGTAIMFGLYNMAGCSLWERESGLFRIPGRRCGWKGESIR